MPASTTQIVEFLAAFAVILAVVTLERRLPAIQGAQHERGFVSPVYDGALKETFVGIKCTVGTRQRNVQPTLTDNVLRMSVMVERHKANMAEARKYCNCSASPAHLPQ